MGILSWLTRRRPVALDEDDFKDEIRGHPAHRGLREDRLAFMKWSLECQQHTQA